MSSGRQHQVAKIWPWLPTFRLAAEYESLQRASMANGVTVSAVARTIKQLEQELGFPVFVREKTGVRLTPRGERLLEATRGGMRVVDDVLNPRDAWCVAAEPPMFQGFLASAAPLDDDLHHQPPMRAEHAAPALAHGELDLYVGSAPLRHQALQSQALGSLPMVYVSPPGAPQQVMAPLDELQPSLILARRLKQRLLLPALLAPETWPRERATPLHVFVTFRRGCAARSARLVEALRSGLD
ncbi:MAG: hypothetical protein DI536_23975 [Archangium gephyra]|uniref:HTH lysR-type domain-containing protein n=1 Tax=Archangium gephyra TaxID=48 RepID=A0A2W5TC38_9BACT|nr:MAG: hypothetical protein DI536_23975 [Archangium gephyra]